MHTLSNLDVDGLIVLDGRHDWTHEFQENNERLMRLYLFAFGFAFLNESLHDFGVFAGMDGEHPALQERSVLFCYGLVLVFCVDVFEYLFGGEWLADMVAAFDPKARSIVVLIVWDVNWVLSELFLLLLELAIASHLQKPKLVRLRLLNDLLFSELLYSCLRGCCGHQILFVCIWE